MQRITTHSLLLLILLVLVGCQKPAPKSDEVADDATAEAVEETEEGPVDTTPLKADFDAELIYSFEGALGEDSDRRPEDNTPVQHHEADLEEGDFIYVEMNAQDQFRTYLMIATPNRTGGYQNGECYPGQGLSSCIRFQANQSGTYLFMANAAAPTSRGAYTLKVYKETEEQAKANAAAHAIVAEQSQKRLDQHLRLRKEKQQKRIQERLQRRREANERAAGEDSEADKANGAPALEEDAPAEKDAPK